MKSGVYFVHYNDIDAFLDAAEKAGRTPMTKGSYNEVKQEKYKNKYRVFSIDGGKHREGSKRIGYWGTHPLKHMEDWADWSFTDKYIEHWQRKKVIL